MGTVGVLIVAAVCVRLGFWQLDRLAQRRALNAAIAARAEMPPLSLERLPSDTTGIGLRRVVLTGEYLNDATVVLAGRSHGGLPGVHLFTPLQLDGSGDVILVNRGWVPSPDAATVDLSEYVQEGRVTVNGIFLPFEDDGAESGIVSTIPAGAGGATGAGAETSGAGPGSPGWRVVWHRLDGRGMVAQYPAAYPSLYVQAVAMDESNVLPLELPIPELDEGMHLSYAIQWFSFAVTFLVGWTVVLLRRGSSPEVRAPDAVRVVRVGQVDAGHSTAGE